MAGRRNQIMRRIAYLAGASLLLASMSVAVAQKKSGAETSLIGIHLYDSGLKVVSVFGTPTSVEAVNIGGTGGGAAGPAGGKGGGRVAGGGPPAPGGPVGMTGPSSSGNSFGFGDALLAQAAAGGSAPMLRAGRGRFDESNRAAAHAGGRRRPAGGKGGHCGGRPWRRQRQCRALHAGVYNRAGCKYGFVFDKFNHVIQIEAIGMSNPRVHTQRGIGFGSSFAQIIKKYSKNPDGSPNAPDGYEVSGDTIVVHYLVTNKVAFRLTRLGKDKPQVVTGIAVAAGKI